MKRFVLILSAILFFSNQAFAACDYLSRCPVKNVDGLAKVGDFLSDATGTTFLAEQFAQNMIKKELEKALGQDFDVELKALNVAELVNGNFESLTISRKNFAFQGVNISSIKIQTLCNFNSINLKSKPIKLNENMVLGFWFEISENDLKNTLAYDDYAKMIGKIDLSSIGLTSCRIYPQTINFSEGKLYGTINAAPNRPPYRPFDIAVEADIKIQDEQVVSSKINLVNIFMNFDLTKFSDALNPAKYLKFPLVVFGNSAEVQIRNVNMVGNSIFVDGMAIIPKG